MENNTFPVVVQYYHQYKGSVRATWTLSQHASGYGETEEEVYEDLVRHTMRIFEQSANAVKTMFAGDPRVKFIKFNLQKIEDEE